MKYKRNDPCWCGSGIKYKKCHLNRHLQEPISKSKIYKNINSFNKKKYCNAPMLMKKECSKKIIKAHSVSKSSSLKEISDNGHVLTTFGMRRNLPKSNKFDLKPVGIKKASTFTGFCSYHDDNLFSSIENLNFKINNKTCFLIAFRTVARELFVKEWGYSTLSNLNDIDKGMTIDSQIEIQEKHKHLNTNNDLTKNDLTYIKSKMDIDLIHKNYKNFEHLVFILENPPKIMASSVGAPVFDFMGNTIQKLSKNQEVIPDYIITNSFSNNGCGYIVFSWIKEHAQSCKLLLSSLQKTNSISDSIICYFFVMMENIYISPTWWGELDTQKRDILLKKFAQGAFSPTLNNALISNETFNGFTINSIRKIGYN